MSKPPYAPHPGARRASFAFWFTAFLIVLWIGTGAWGAYWQEQAKAARAGNCSSK